MKVSKIFLTNKKEERRKKKREITFQVEHKVFRDEQKMKHF